MRTSTYSNTHEWWFEPPRLVDWFKARYPHETAKRIALELNAPVRTVENWLSGGAPSLPWFIKMIAAYGPDFLSSVLTNCPEWLDAARVEAQRAEVSREMDMLARRQTLLERQAGIKHEQ